MQHVLNNLTVTILLELLKVEGSNLSTFLDASSLIDQHRDEIESLIGRELIVRERHTAWAMYQKLKK